VALIAGVVVVAAMLVSACGSDAQKVDPAADLAAAKAALLTSADLPGYAAKPHRSSDDAPKVAQREFAQCLRVPNTMFDEMPGGQSADSPDFEKGDAEVQSSVSIAPTLAELDQKWGVVTKRGVEECLGNFIDAALATQMAPAGVTVGRAKVTRFDPRIGSDSVGYRALVAGTERGLTLHAYVDFVLVRRDRAVISLEAFREFEPFDRATEIALGRKMYDRVDSHAT